MKLEYYRRRQGKFRWKVTASNGERVAASTQGYKLLRSCVDNAKKVLQPSIFATGEKSLNELKAK